MDKGEITYDLEISGVNIPTYKTKTLFSLYQVVQVFLNPSLSLLCVIILLFSFIIEKKVKSSPTVLRRKKKVEILLKHIQLGFKGKLFQLQVKEKLRDLNFTKLF